MKNPVTKPETVNLQYHFSTPELGALGKELGEAQIKLRQLDDDRKMVADEWKAKISSQEAQVNSLSNKTASGYEYRDTPCTATMHEPKAGFKTLRRDDNGDIVKSVVMTEREMELPLGIDDAEKDDTALFQKEATGNPSPPATSGEDADLAAKWLEVRDSEGKTGKPTTSALQKKLGIGYTQAVRVLELIGDL